ncbi:nuclear speckle splicing regulatory protein 1, partial [Clarias magur]
RICATRFSHCAEKEEKKMAASGGKQYGLIIPQKSASKSAPLSRPSIFGDDSDDERSVGESLQKEAIKKKMMKQTRLEMQKALEQDSSVYEYDSVYDDIQKQRLESNKKLLGGADRKPKYITQLMHAVEERKKEQERREDRKIQKEREAEGEQFADKEAYVTSAYRQKLKERQEELEKERRAAELEAALDVKKQKDLSGFYRHLLNQTVGEEPLPDRSTD